MRLTVPAMCWLLLAGGTTALVQAAAGQSLDVPMDRELVGVVLRFGLENTEPSTWEGTYRLTEGRIVATDGWRFTANDHATLTQFKFAVRRFYPRFWTMRDRDPKSFSVEPNGIILTLADLSKSSVLEVKTSRGDFTVPVGKLQYGATKRALDRQVDYQRVPASRQIVKAATEDAFPSAVAGPQNRIHVAYIAFKHGEGFEKRPPMKAIPQDFSFLQKPTGGDQLMFTEFDGKQWSAPLPLTRAGGDLFGTATAVDGKGRVWVFWSANVESNWDVYGTVRTAGRWSEPIRISSGTGSDFHHAAATDAEGRVWLAWQGFGEVNSDIYVARQEGDAFGKPTVIADGPANDWSPAIATSGDGRVAVAWDTYQRGNYDVLVKVCREGRWGKARVIAATLSNEARPSLVFDKKNRLWAAYEISPEGWGKDFGPYDRSPQKTALYRQRSVGVQVLDNGTLDAPAADVNRALPVPSGQPRWPKSGDGVLAAGPKLAVDASGRIWLSARIRLTRFDSAVGGTWMSFLTTLEADKWRTAFMVPETDGFLHQSPALVPAADAGLYVVSASDGRFRDAAFFGLPRKTRKRGKNVPPPSTRNYGIYPDTLFNKEIAVAETGALGKPAGPPKLADAETEEPAKPAAESRAEAQQVAAIRAYRAEIGGKTLRIARGEFHRHTEISSDGAGDGTIFDMWRYGIDMAALDWIGNGDHDNGGGREISWHFTQKTTSIFNVPASFTSMYTYERSCNYPDGHRNAVFTRRGIRPLARLQGGKGKIMDDLPADAPRPNTPDTQMFYKYLRQFDGVCASHTSATNMGTDWRDNDPQVEPIVEIYQGDRQNYERPGAPRSNTAAYSLGGWRPFGFVSLALLKGYRLGFQSSSDHISTHMSYCNVWVKQPTREAILDGMKRRRVYGATDNIIADVRCGEHFMGEEFTVDKPPTLHIKLIGTAPFAEVVIVKDNEYVYTAAPKTRTFDCKWTDHAAKPGKTSYYYVRGTQVGEETEITRRHENKKVKLQLNNGELVWVSPMWITYKP